MKALITGASSGIGKDMAKILNQKGYNLVLVARDIEKLEQTKKELEKSVQNEPTIENNKIEKAYKNSKKATNKIEKAYKNSKKATNKIEIIQMDLSEEQNCIELANKVKDIDILINNAGFGDCGRFSETDLNKDISMIKTNVIAYHILTKLYLKEMKKKNRTTTIWKKIKKHKFISFVILLFFIFSTFNIILINYFITILQETYY